MPRGESIQQETAELIELLFLENGLQSIKSQCCTWLTDRFREKILSQASKGENIDFYSYRNTKQEEANERCLLKPEVKHFFCIKQAKRPL